MSGKLYDIKRPVLIVCFLYLLFGMLWILLSDRTLMLFFPDAASYAAAQTFKGSAFVLASTALLYVVLERYWIAWIAAMRKSEQMADSLRASQQTLTTLMENAPGLVYQCKNDTDWTMDFVSEGARAITGYAPDDFTSGRVAYASLIHAEDRRAVWDGVQTAIAEERPFQLEYRIAAKDGTSKWVWEQGRAINETTLQGIVIDITRQKLNELRNLQLATAVEHASQAFMLTGPEGRLIYVNPAFTRITGFAAREAIGQTPRILKSGKHEDKFYEDLWKTIKAGRTWRGHFTNRKKDGSLYEAESTITPVMNPRGEIVNYVAIQDDVTAETQMAAQLRQSQKMEAIGTLAGGIAHDFNNILAAMLGYSQFVYDELPQDSPLRSDMELVLQAGNRAKELVRQILTFSRQSDEKPKPIVIGHALHESLKLLRATLPANVEIREIMPGDDITAVASPSQVQQIVMNLCANAFHAMPQGGVLEVRLEAVTVGPQQVKASVDLAQKEYARLTVSDTGEGMDKDTLDRIFDPFFTTKPVDMGTGLGLATVYGIVKSLGGAITVYSEPGHGTTFHVYFPLGGEPAAAPEDRRPVVAPRGHGELILVVDDESALVRLVSRVLEILNYRVIACESVAEALPALEERGHEIALLLTDQTMPEMSGIELINRARETHAQLPAILMTGFSEGVTEQKLAGAGTITVLRKPFEQAELARVLRALLDGYVKAQTDPPPG